MSQAQDLPKSGHVRTASTHRDHRMSQASNVAIFFSLCAFFSGSAIFLFRAPFGVPNIPQVLYYCLAATLLMVAAVFGVGAKRNDRSPLAFFLALAVPLLPAAAPDFAWLMGLCAIVFCVLAARAGATRPSNPLLVLMLVGALLFALFHFFLINSLGYATIFSPENWIAGNIHPDTLFHAAIASMIAEYGAVSTGLDGFVPLSYHILSHVWLGLLAKAAGLTAIYGYFLGVQVIGVPLLFFTLSLATLACLDSPQSVGTVPIIVVPLALILLVGIGSWNSYLLSESYILALIVLLAGLPFLRALALRADGHPTSGQMVVGLLVGALAFTAKVSVGGVWLCGFLYLLSRSKLHVRDYALVCAMLVAIGWLAVSTILPREHVGTAVFRPFHYFVYPEAALANILAIGAAAIVLMTRYRSSCRGERRWSEVVLVMFLASVVPAFAFQFEGGAAYYFLNIATWIAVAVLSASLIDAAKLRVPRVLSVVAIALTAVSIMASPEKRGALVNFAGYRDGVHFSMNPREVTAGYGPFSFVAVQRIAETFGKSNGARVVAELHRLGVTRGSDALVFVPPEADWFWSSHSSCTVPPFGVPAVLGVPMLMGLPPASRDCDLGRYYSLPDYGPESRSRAQTDASLCVAALARGVHSVVVFDARIESRLLNCTE